MGAGGILEISVWKDPALTRQVVVLPDGPFTFPLVGRCTAAGNTVDADLRKQSIHRYLGSLSDVGLLDGFEKKPPMARPTKGRAPGALPFVFLSAISPGIFQLGQRLIG